MNGHKLLEALTEPLEKDKEKAPSRYLTSSGSPEKLRQRVYSIMSRWLSAHYNWEMDADKTLLRSVERLIKGKIAGQDKAVADRLERELMRVCYNPDFVVIEFRCRLHDLPECRP